MQPKDQDLRLIFSTSDESRPAVRVSSARLWAWQKTRLRTVVKVDVERIMPHVLHLKQPLWYSCGPQEEVGERWP
jgi:hypothetical protein